MENKSLASFICICTTNFSSFYDTASGWFSCRHKLWARLGFPWCYLCFLGVLCRTNWQLYLTFVHPDKNTHDWCCSFVCLVCHNEIVCHRHHCNPNKHSAGVILNWTAVTDMAVCLSSRQWKTLTNSLGYGPGILLGASKLILSLYKHWDLFWLQRF